MIYTPSPEEGPSRQGEIVSNVVQYVVSEKTNSREGTLSFRRAELPLALIISQDCDLDLEFRARNNIAFENGKVPNSNQITNILFCEVYTSDEIKVEQDIKRDIFRRIESNSDERYQYLRSVSAEEDAVGEGLPYMVIDFKRHFSIACDEVYALLSSPMRRRCFMTSPYMEHLSTRFSRYLSRIALPEDH